MSRKPKTFDGGIGTRAGARKKLTKQVSLVSEAWDTLATTTISMLKVVGSIDEFATADCMKEVAQLQEMNKKCMSHEDRLQLLDAINQMIENFLSAFASMDAEARVENNVADLFENFYRSMFSIVTESLEGINKTGVTEQVKEQLQQQLCMVVRLINTLMTVSCENDVDSALVYFKPFADTLFELCCNQLCLGSQYDFSVRSMAAGLLTEQIESSLLNSYLYDPSNKNIIELIIDTCFKLCAKDENESGEMIEEEEDDEDPNEETSQTLGTLLLAKLTSSILSDSDRSITAPIIFARSSAVLSQPDAPKLDVKAALIVLGVLPESATPFTKTPGYVNTAFGFLQSFIQSSHEPIVRYEAIMAVAEHFEHLKTEVKPFMSNILTSIIQALTDPLEKTPLSVKLKASHLLNYLVESSEELPAEYLLPSSDKNLFRFFLSQLKPFLTQSFSNLTQDEHDFYLGVPIDNIHDFVSSYARAVAEENLPPQVGDYFQPFQEEANQLMLELSHRLSEIDPLGRVVCLTSAGIIGATMTPNVLLPKMALISDALRLGMRVLELVEALPDQVFSLRQDLHATWSALAKKLKGAIEPFVGVQVPYICCALSAAIEEEEMGDAEGEGDEVGEKEATPRENEQVVALECYKDFLVALGPKFAPFQERCFTCITENYTTFSSGVMKQVVNVLDTLPASLYPLPASITPTPGVDLVLPQPKLGELLRECKNILFHYMKHSTDATVVRDSMDTLAGYLNVYGQIVVNDDANTLAEFEKITRFILKHNMSLGDFRRFSIRPGFDDADWSEDETEEKEHEDVEMEAVTDDAGGTHTLPGCGENSDTNKSCSGGDEEQTAEEEDESAILIDTVFYLLCALAKAKGSTFKSTLDVFWATILKLRKKKGYHSATNGFFADLAEALDEVTFDEYRKQVMPLLLADLNDTKTSPIVLRNTAFAVGEIILHTSVESCKEYYQSAVAGFLFSLKSIQAVIDTKSDDAKSSDLLPDLYAARHNVIAGLGRLLMVGMTELNDPVTLISTFLGGLPLMNDFTPQVCATIAHLVHTLPATHPGMIEVHYPTLIQLLADTIVNQSGQSETEPMTQLKSVIIKTARTILSAQPTACQQLNQNVKEEFIRLLEESSVTPVATEEKSQ